VEWVLVHHESRRCGAVFVRSLLAYTLARALLFVVALGIVYLLGARDWLALIIALVLSGLVSYVLLSRQRDAVSAKIMDGMSRMKSARRRLDEGSAREDAAQDTEPGNTAQQDTVRGD
jgi:hypothetical protein